jgi:hypothetical protein
MKPFVLIDSIAMSSVAGSSTWTPLSKAEEHGVRTSVASPRKENTCLDEPEGDDKLVALEHTEFEVRFAVLDCGSDGEGPCQPKACGVRGGQEGGRTVANADAALAALLEDVAQATITSVAGVVD